MYGITEIQIEGFNECAYISMNKQQISKIEIDNGSATETKKVGITKPFVFILPLNSGAVTIYDINGNVVESIQEKL